jgi:hypothetical protein
VTSIPYVRSQIARIRGRATSAVEGIAFDGAAVALAALAVALERRLLAGAVAVAVVVLAQRLMARAEPPRPVVIGIRQMMLGLGVALTAAIGVLAAAG